MAQEVILTVEAKTADAVRNLEVLNSTIDEQKQILIELEKELYKVEAAQKNTSKTNLAAQTQLRQEADHLKDSIKDQRLALKELNLQQQQTKSSLDGVSHSSQKVASSFEDVAANGGAIAILDALTGGLASRIRDAFEATKLFNLSLKGTKTALLATGVGAIVVALGTIVAYWDDIVGFIKGSNDALKLSIDLNKKNLTEIDHQISQLELQKQILEANGQSTGAINKQIEESILLRQEENRLLTENLKKQLEAEQAEVRKTTFLEDAEISLYRALGLTERMAKAQAEAAVGTEEQREKLEELNASIRESETKQLEFEAKLAALRKSKRDKEAEEIKKSREEKETQLQLEQEYAAKRIALIQKEIEEEYNLRLQGEEKIGALRRQFFEKNLGDSEAANLIRSQNERERIIAEIEESGALEAQKRMAIAEVNKFYDNEELRIKKESADKQTEIDKKAAEARLQNLNAVGNALSNFASLVGEQTGAGKAAAIASTLISTYQSAQSSYASLAPIPIVGPALGAAAAAVAVASGLKQIQAIKSVKVPKERGASSAATPSASTITAATSQAPQFNIIGGGAQNQLAGLLADQSQKPVKAYVVSNEVSTAQSLDRNIVESATLG
jgi:hypothetical protein